MFNNNKNLFLICFSILFFLAGCFNNDSSGTNKQYGIDTEIVKYNGAGLIKSKSTHETNNFLKKLAKSQVKRYFNQINDSDFSGATPMDDQETAVNASDCSDNPEYSQTNVQETGVDEADFVKTDGNHIYIISGKYFHIFQSLPANELKELSFVELDGIPYEMFVDDDKVIIFSKIYNYSDNKLEIKTNFNTLTKISIFDISDLKNPVLIRKTYIEGSYSTARKIENKIYIVVNSSLYNLTPNNLIYNQFKYSHDELSKISKQTKILKKIDKINFLDYLPKYYDFLMHDNKFEMKVINSYDNLYLPKTQNGLGSTSIITYDLNDTAKMIERCSILSYNNKIYSSKNNLYIAAENFSNWFGNNVWGDNEWTQKTFIHKFNYTNELSYESSGVVKGYILNQFSMSEYNNYFRVATTYTEQEIEPEQENPTWNMYSNLFILEQANENMNIVGEITNIEPNERIFAARFIKDKAFLITFEQIDPLLTIDLSNVKDPRIIGKLEIPGFTNYLHPIDENHLIGIGQNINSEGQFDGLQLDIFDVTDFDNPIRKHHIVIGTEWGWPTSEARYNHKAFQYFESKSHNYKVLSIPISYYKGVSGNREFFNGAVLFDIDLENGFENRRELDHSEFYSPMQETDWWCYWNHNYNVRRSIFINENSYTISGFGIKVNNVNTFEEVSKIALPGNSWDYGYYPLGAVD